MAIAERTHLYPYRTQKLSSLASNGVGFTPCETRTLPGNFGGLAQLGEHLPYKQGVSGSIPLTSTILIAGKIAKRLNAADCKSAPSGSGVRIPLSPYTLMGYSQAVRQGTLTPSCVGSNPATPVLR